ncbi:MAG: hypothetical protein NTY37_04950 [Methanothrix sp.]|nr:hypothetical protein [Methanothrix sp.]
MLLQGGDARWRAADRTARELARACASPAKGHPRTRGPTLGSARKMDAAAASQKARERKAEALGMQGLSLL